jgi:hypothetical protein
VLRTSRNKLGFRACDSEFALSTINVDDEIRRDDRCTNRVPYFAILNYREVYFTPRVRFVDPAPNASSPRAPMQRLMAWCRQVAAVLDPQLRYTTKDRLSYIWHEISDEN